MKTVEGGRRVVLSLIPSGSSETEGVKFQVYSHRLQNFFHLSDDAALELLPAHREHWTYDATGGPDYEGFEGYFADRAEVDRFVKGLQPRTA